MFFTSLLSSNLTTKNLAKDIQHIISTTSTNDEIWNMFSNNEIDLGGVLVAEQQTKGRGRRSNAWHSSMGESLTFSFIIDDKITIPEIISLCCGVGIVNGIKEFTKVQCSLKWPNDIMFNDSKIGGILIEKKKNFLIVGIGINVNEDTLNSKITNKAISLKKILNYAVQREPLLAYILNNIEHLLNSDNAVTINMWLSLCNHINKKINFCNSNQEIIKAEFLTINNNGEAVLNINGKKKIMQSGIIQ